MVIALYIVGQERRLVDPPSHVVTGVRTVTTKKLGTAHSHVAVPNFILYEKNSRLQSGKNIYQNKSGRSHDLWILLNIAASLLLTIPNLN